MDGGALADRYGQLPRRLSRYRVPIRPVHSHILAIARAEQRADRRTVRHHQGPRHLSRSEDGGIQYAPVLAAEPGHECAIYRTNHENGHPFWRPWVSPQT